jgi:hypothetical protein
MPNIDIGVCKITLHRLNGDLPASAGAVFNHHALAVAGGHLGGHTPADGVAGATGTEAGDDLHRFEWCGLCSGLPAGAGKCRSGSGVLQDLAAAVVHRRSPFQGSIDAMRGARPAHSGCAMTGPARHGFQG